MYRKPWERQENESTSAFYAFTIYRDLGHERSLRRVAERLASEGDQGPVNATGAGGGPTDGGFRLIVRPPGWGPDDPATKRLRKAVPGKVNAWAKQWSWVDRARAWDEEIDRHVRAAFIDEIKRMARRQAQEARAACAVRMAVVTRALERLQLPEEQERLRNIPIEELLRFAIEATATLPKLHEAERDARCIRVRNMLLEDGTVTTEWEIFERRPPREDPQVQLEKDEKIDAL